MARLRVELRLQLAEVEASRARIVEAGYEERRRLERDLHDGAQQRLVSLGVQVRRLQRGLPRGAAVLSPALDRVVDEIGGAIGDLRQIAAGVRPARLDDGLSAALADLARSAPIPVDVDVPHERVQASVEAAAYFVACEALTNAVRYASASRVSMRAVRENGTLLVSITDDGIGGAVVRRGSGLAGPAGSRGRPRRDACRLEPSGPGHTRGGGDPVRIVIADDTVLLREGVAGLLEDAGHTVVARVGDAEALLSVVAEHEPDLAIVDVRMPPTYEDEGMRAAAEIRQRRPETAVLVLSQHVESNHAVELVGSGGGFGYLLKDRVLDVDEFLEAAERVSSGGSALDPEVVKQLLVPPAGDDTLDQLTPREREVLGLMAEGRTNAGIAKQLWLTERTVETHVSSILGKLDLHGADGHRRVLAVLAYLRAAA